MEQALCFFADRPRVGKDHLASVLIDMGFLRVAFADALYEEVASGFGVPISYLQEPRRKDVPQPCLRVDFCLDPDFAALLKKLNKVELLSPRETVQLWGTEYRREQDDDYWVNRARCTIRKIKPEKVLFTDTRFLNEFVYAEQLGCEFWKIIPAGPASFMPSSGTGHVSNMVGQWWVPDRLLLNVFGSRVAEDVLRETFGS